MNYLKSQFESNIFPNSGAKNYMFPDFFLISWTTENTFAFTYTTGDTFSEYIQMFHV